MMEVGRGAFVVRWAETRPSGREGERGWGRPPPLPQKNERRVKNTVAGSQESAEGSEVESGAQKMREQIQKKFGNQN